MIYKSKQNFSSTIYKPELIGDKCCIQSGSFPLGLATFVTFLVQEI